MCCPDAGEPASLRFDHLPERFTAQGSLLLQVLADAVDLCTVRSFADDRPIGFGARARLCPKGQIAGVGCQQRIPVTERVPGMAGPSEGPRFHRHPCPDRVELDAAATDQYMPIALDDR